MPKGKIVFKGREIRTPGSYMGPMDENGNVAEPPEKEKISIDKRIDHLTVNILDALRLPDFELCELFKAGDGKSMWSSDIRRNMTQLRQNGFDVVPACDHHDKKGRCLGHNKDYKDEKPSRYWLVSKYMPSVFSVPSGFADVNCVVCNHKMSEHDERGDCQHKNCEVIIKAPCHLGPARRDDLTDRIEELEKQKMLSFEELKKEAEDLWPRRQDLSPRTMREEAMLNIFCSLINKQSFAIKAWVTRNPGPEPLPGTTTSMSGFASGCAIKFEQNTCIMEHSKKVLGDGLEVIKKVLDYATDSSLARENRMVWLVNTVEDLLAGKSIKEPSRNYREQYFPTDKDD